MLNKNFLKPKNQRRKYSWIALFLNGKFKLSEYKIKNMKLKYNKWKNNYINNIKINNNCFVQIAKNHINNKIMISKQ